MSDHTQHYFHKLCGIKAYAPNDNVSELTARVNDGGWQAGFANWLKGSRVRADDEFQAVVCHGTVTHPKLIVNEMKPESTR